MKRIGLFAAVCVVSVCIFSVRVWAEDSAEIEAQTIETALLWIVLVDEGLYGQSWEQTSQKFKDAMDKEEWIEKLEMYRGSLGAVKSREVLDKGFFESIPNHPGMSMMVIQFKASFEDKEYAVETVSTIRIDDGPWQVAGYFIADSIDIKVQ